jgi:pimeloyl-ACP methyl ester carboxylesterase
MKVIFVHGSGGYSGVWRYQTDYFPDSHAVNLPGHLQGQRLNSVEEHVDWLRDYVRDNGLRDVVLTGHSFGGAIALMYALRYPEELRAIIIIGSGARLKVHPALIAALEKAVNGNPDGWWQEVAAGYHLTPRDYAREILETQKAMGPAVMLNDFLCCDAFDVMDRVQEIKLPALIVCGEKDMLTPVKYARYLGANLASSQVLIVPGATHFVFAEKPDVVNKAIDGFLNRISSS